MKEIIKMVVVLALICGVSGLLLAGVNTGTKEQRKMQVLKFVKGPALHEVLAGSENEPLDSVKEVTITDANGESRVVDIFPAYKEGELWAVALEDAGAGYGGTIGVIVGIDVSSEELLGIGITEHKETPGLGSRVNEAGFRGAFEAVALDDEVGVTADGGSVDAVSGATISSKAVCEAVNKAVAFYKANKDSIIAAVKP